MVLANSKQKKIIGERLKAERERLGFNELQIAQLIGVPLDEYQKMELGDRDPGIFVMPRLSACGFEINFIILGERLHPLKDESELLRRFRELSLKGRSSVFMTLDALEQLAPNIRTNIRETLREKIKNRFNLD